MHKPEKPRVGLFLTCLVDLFRPQIGVAMVSLLERSGCNVHIPIIQTCCGQPAHSQGDGPEFTALAYQTIDLFEDYDYLVTASDACAHMITHHYPHLLKTDQTYAERAGRLSAKTYGLLTFLTEVLGFDGQQHHFSGSVIYHNAYTGPPKHSTPDPYKAVLQSIEGVEFSDTGKFDLCCGLGNSACNAHARHDHANTQKLIQAVKDAGADFLISQEPGCLIHLARHLKQAGCQTEVCHISELLTRCAFR